MESESRTAAVQGWFDSRGLVAEESGVESSLCLGSCWVGLV